MIKNTSKKKKLQLISDSFEKELIEIIDSRINNSQELLAENDIAMIISTLLPDIDKMISDKIKNHMKFLGETLIENLKQE